MNENEKIMTEAESLSIISGMINRARNRFSETGTLYLLWGWVILVCCISQFVLIYFLKYPKGYQVWFLTWLAVISINLYTWQKLKKEELQKHILMKLRVLCGSLL